MSRRERRRRPARGAPIRVKPPFPFSLFTNVRLFYIIMAIGAAGLVLGSFSSGLFGTTQGRTPQQEPTPAPTPAEASPTPLETPPATTPAPTRRYSAPPPLTIDTAKRYFVTVKTEKGDVRLELLPQEAPQAVNNFLFLARDRFYDGLTFHWVLPGFAAQAGDPTGAGSGGPGYNLAFEKNNLRHDAGVVAMAQVSQGLTLSGSQFYITLSPQLHLDGRDTVFGRVVSGLEVLSQLPARDPQKDPSAPPGVKILGMLVQEGQ